ncbi:MAG TPA: aspartate/glutamate racemase family protein, partial [Thermoanaerobaculia bacterium]|nr:aspartate/glutamate racemase family protein [Thermoanaerobaculia bacterium]
VGELMLDSAQKLAKSGADFLICPDNTIHKALPLIESRSPLPWLSIADVVTGEAKRRGFKRIGLTGTKWLVASDVYPADYVRPDAHEREEVNRIIMEELVNGIQSPESAGYLIRLIDSMQRAGCDAVVLGCTEMPLVISDANSPLPTLDSTRLLARAALARATTSSRA